MMGMSKKWAVEKLKKSSVRRMIKKSPGNIFGKDEPAETFMMISPSSPGTMGRVRQEVVKARGQYVQTTSKAVPILKRRARAPQRHVDTQD
jgi:hypothetical protein